MMRKLWRNRWALGGVVLLLGGVIVLLVGMALTAPARVIRLIEAEGEKNVHGTLQVEGARLQVLRGIQLAGISVTPEWESEPAIRVDYLRCDWNASALLYGEIEPRRLVFLRPRVRLEIDEEGITNLERLFIVTEEPIIDPLKYQRYFADGIRIESGLLHWQAPTLFGDDRPRIFEGMDVDLVKATETFNRWEVQALVRGSVLSGTRIEGWMDLTPKKERVVFRGSTEEVAISRDLLRALPADLRDMLARFEMDGHLSAQATLDYRRGQGIEYALDVQLHNVDARDRASDLAVESLDARLRLDTSGFACDDVAGLLWDGAVQGGVVGRPTGMVIAWIRLDQADLASLAEQLGLQDRQLSGVLNGSVRFRYDPRRAVPLTAEGSLSIANAYLARMPVLLQVFRLLNFQLPGDEVFDRGECLFTMLGDKIYIEQMTISSPSVDITGTGTITFDQQADLILLVASADHEGGWLPMRPVRVIIAGISRQINPPVAVRGPLSNPEVAILPMESVKRQFRYLRDLLPFVGE